MTDTTTVEQQTVTLADGPAPDIFATIPKEETIAIIVPLYELVKDGLTPAVNYQMLEVALLRLRSYFHKSYLIFVEKLRTTDEALAVVQGHLVAKNAILVDTEDFASYGMYLQDGIDAAKAQTSSNYFIIASPWQMIGNNSVDFLLERINKVDVAMCSGFDVRTAGIPASDFDSHTFNPPREFRALDLNFFGFKRAVADGLTIDPKYKTKELLQRDFFQVMHSRGYNVITSQQVPIYTFDIDWTALEGDAELAEDKEYFKSKWGILPA